jgi:hypothetical protein
VGMLQAMIRLYKGPTDNARVVKYHIVILFPQLSAEEITSCTKCARLVGSLTVGNELDDLVHQTVLAYVKARNFPSSLFFFFWLITRLYSAWNHK